jgi:hypothetical protein
MTEDLALFEVGPAVPRTRTKMRPRRSPTGASEQLDVRYADEEPTTAFPTIRSATGLRPKVAKRCGYDYISCCRWCADAAILIGEWRPNGWIHRSTGEAECRQQLRRRGIWRMKEDGGVV